MNFDEVAYVLFIPTDKHTDVLLGGSCSFRPPTARLWVRSTMAAPRHEIERGWLPGMERLMSCGQEMVSREACAIALVWKGKLLPHGLLAMQLISTPELISWPSVTDICSVIQHGQAWEMLGLGRVVVLDSEQKELTP